MDRPLPRPAATWPCRRHALALGAACLLAALRAACAGEPLDTVEMPFALETEHFRLLTDVSREWLAGRAHELELFRAGLTKQLPFPEPARLRTPRVVLFAARADYEGLVEGGYPAYRGRSAFYVFRFGVDEENDPTRWSWWLTTWRRPEDAQTRRELYHELTHVLLNYHLRRPPPWLDEGLAEYFETAEEDAPGRLAVGGINRTDLPPLREAIAAAKVISVRSLVGIDAQLVGGWTNMNYNQAWSLVHFLRHGRGGALRPAFDAFLRAAQAGEPYGAAFERHVLAAAAGAGGWNALHLEWQEYVKGLE